jgi:hypothetical protein
MTNYKNTVAIKTLKIKLSYSQKLEKKTRE